MLYPLSCGPTAADINIDPVFSSVNEYPNWTSDGTKIVYYHSGIIDTKPGGAIIDKSLIGLWIMNKDGSDQRKLLDVFARYGRFSSAGNWLVYDLSGIIYKAPFTGDSIIVAEKVQLTTGGRNSFPGFSPNGEWISYRNFVPDTVSLSAIRIMKSDGSENMPIPGSGFEPSWHPNGKEIIAYTRVGPLTSAKKFVRYFPFDSTMPDTLNAVEGNDNQYPGYSPDGKKIVFSSQPPREQTFVYTMNSDGTGIRKLEEGRQPTWSPDGSEIVFIRTHESIQGSGLETVWVMDSNGTNIRQLIFGPEYGGF